MERKNGTRPPRRWLVGWWKPREKKPIVIDLTARLAERNSRQPDPTPPAAALKRSA